MLARCALWQAAPRIRPRSAGVYAIRSLATSTKPSIAHIAQLRKLLPGTSMVKAREALAATSDSVQDALAWLETDMQVSGAKKASKVGDRVAKEGGIAVCIVSDGAPAASLASSVGQQATFEPLTVAARAGMVELNCETDFVGRNEIFQKLLRDIAHTVALFPALATEDVVASAGASSHAEHGLIDIPTAQLLDFPLIPQPNPSATANAAKDGSETTAATASAPPKTIGRTITDTIARLGERIHLARAASVANAVRHSPDAPRRSQNNRPSTAPILLASTFTHGSTGSTAGQQTSAGRVGSLLLTRVQRSSMVGRDSEQSLKALRGLARSLARQAAGMPTRKIESDDDTAEGDAESILYAQEFFMKLSAARLPEQIDAATAGETVQQALQSWGKAWMGLQTVPEASCTPVRVVAMRRWQLGEPFDGKEEMKAPLSDQ